MPTATSEMRPQGIGTKLRDARLERALSIEEIAWRTRIWPDLIRAIEDDDFDAIGHEGHVRGHLSSYARFLGLDPAPVVGEFIEALGGQVSSAIEALDRQRREERKPPRPKWLIAASISGAMLLAASAAGMLGGKTERPSAQVLPPRLAAPAVTHGSSRSADRGPVPAALAKVALRVEATESTRVSVTADGAEVFDGVLAAGKIRAFRARTSIEILVARAGAVRLSLNGDDLGVQGTPGAVFRARYGPRGRID